MTNWDISQAKVYLTMWGSMPLMIMSTTVVIVLHSTEAVHILHESWPSCIAGYSMYRWAPLHTSRVGVEHHYKAVQWFHLACSVPAEVSPDVSVQITKGPPLVSCGSHESLLLYPLIPNQTDPKRVHSIRTTDWHAKPGSTIYYTWSYPYKIWLYYFYGWSLHEWVLRFGYDNYHRLLESTRHSPKLSESTERSFRPITPNLYSSH
jgi:hypothetical protein